AEFGNGLNELAQLLKERSTFMINPFPEVCLTSATFPGSGVVSTIKQRQPLIPPMHSTHMIFLFRGKGSFLRPKRSQADAKDRPRLVI
ncbi:hypothetical protein, partial [Rhizobium leguminosarum]|uniref:hypothetical protein n=1 Tax=Rhizobium leguminosarum TaxID=384 RepID=UPI003F9B50F5